MAERKEKPTPNMLGTGTAANAAKLLGNAKSRIDAAIERAVNGKPDKKKKSSS